MRLADAEREFWLRLYAWAKAEWEREIHESLACNETLKYCRYFFDAAPRLLKGLELDRAAWN
ncbi:MAG TPA: hypothetical protein DCY13_07530 [Verrucomicrobiales bacterium]|nr:hypothetical protein [Verrucomicrobiales bacterium]